MGKRIFLFLFCCTMSGALLAQEPKKTVDSLAYYDELFSELDDFMDSLLAPRTMMMVSTGITSAYYNYETASKYDLDGTRKMVIAPSAGYFNKKGWGISASAMITDLGRNYRPYQLLMTGSYDHLKNDAFAAGASFTRIFTKDSLPFYTSPLQNEVATYFTWRKWWVKPALMASYGWGSRSEVEERKEYITSLRLRPTGFTRVDTREQVSDFALTLALRHDFYWLNPLGKKTVFRLTPQLAFTSGTQRFGFTQTSNTYGTTRVTNNKELYSSENNYLDSKLYFQPIALSAYLKPELTIGKFFIQPQASLAYYFPSSGKHFMPNFLLNTGFIF